MCIAVMYCLVQYIKERGQLQENGLRRTAIGHLSLGKTMRAMWQQSALVGVQDCAIRCR